MLSPPQWQSVEVMPAQALLQSTSATPVIAWGLERVTGRLVEISGGSAATTLTFIFRWIRAAQEADEPVAWISGRQSIFFPPDAEASGIDLEALAVIRLHGDHPNHDHPNHDHPNHDHPNHDYPNHDYPNHVHPTGAHPTGPARVADLLVRSGSFGLVVLDLGAQVHMPLPIQSRLAGLARKHRTGICLLTEKTESKPSLGSLVSLRVEASRVRQTCDHPSKASPVRYSCRARILKSKRNAQEIGAPIRVQEEVCRAPDGLC